MLDSCPGPLTIFSESRTARKSSPHHPWDHPRSCGHHPCSATTAGALPLLSAGWPPPAGGADCQPRLRRVCQPRLWTGTGPAGSLGLQPVTAISRCPAAAHVHVASSWTLGVHPAPVGGWGMPRDRLPRVPGSGKPAADPRTKILCFPNIKKIHAYIIQFHTPTGIL